MFNHDKMGKGTLFVPEVVRKTLASIDIASTEELLHRFLTGKNIIETTKQRELLKWGLTIGGDLELLERRGTGCRGRLLL